jgi:hypothetical protein
MAVCTHGVEEFLVMLGVVYRTWRDAKLENLHLLEDATSEKLIQVTKLGGHPGKCDDWTEAIVNELWTVRDGKAVEARIWFWAATRLSKLIIDGKAKPADQAGQRPKRIRQDRSTTHRRGRQWQTTA